MFNVNNSFGWLIISIIAILITGCLNQEDENLTETDQSLYQESVLLSVFKNPTCSCCGKWVEYIENNGFTVEVHDTSDLMAVKRRFDIDAGYRSCHTAVSSDGFVFEGHIPAKFIHQFLSEKPENTIGLAVPAMPVGSPGMEVDNKFMPYQVLLLKADGSSEIYADIATIKDQE